MTHYQDRVVPSLMAELGYSNRLAVPKVVKVVVNIGLKDAAHDQTLLDKVGGQLAAITGQRPKVTRAKRSIADFKIRTGDPVGLAVTLRGRRMWDFLARLVTLVLPRVRDFHGVPATGLDGHGNYTLGLAEMIAFPEVDSAKIDPALPGLEITVVTTAGADIIAKRLLELLGLPFTKD